MALTDNLISYWKLDEASGNALDAHGSNNLTDQNTVGAATGKINNGRDFESGNLEYFTLADNASLSTGDVDFEITGWIKVESNTDGVLLGRWAGAGNLEYVLFYESTTQTIFWDVSNDGSNVAVLNSTGFGAMSTGTWYFITAYHDSVNNEIGVGVNLTYTTLSHSTGVFNSTSNTTMGRIDSAAAAYFDGVMDEFGFWKGRILTSGERSQLYNSGNAFAYPFTSANGAGRLVNSIPLKSMVGGRLAA